MSKFQGSTGFLKLGHNAQGNRLTPKFMKTFLEALQVPSYPLSVLIWWVVCSRERRNGRKTSWSTKFFWTTAKRKSFLTGLISKVDSLSRSMTDELKRIMGLEANSDLQVAQGEKEQRGQRVHQPTAQVLWENELRFKTRLDLSWWAAL